MSSLRNIIILGNIATNPKLINKENNRKLVVFSLQINENFRDKISKRTNSKNFINVKAYNDYAKYIYENLEKGAFIAIDGKRIEKENETKLTTEIQIDEFVILKNNNKMQ